MENLEEPLYFAKHKFFMVRNVHYESEKRFEQENNAMHKIVAQEK